MLDHADISLLLKVWQGVIESGVNDVDMRQLDLSYTERARATQLRFHALIAKVRNDKGRQVPAHWLLTKRGADFLKGRIEVPQFVITFRNEVVDHSASMVSKKDFRELDDFGPHWGWEIVDGNVLKEVAGKGQQSLLEKTLV